MKSVTFTIDENGTIRGFPYHDGWLDAVVLAERRAHLSLRSTDGTKRVLTLEGLAALDVHGLRESNIVLSMRLLSPEAALADQSVRESIRARLYIEAATIPAGSYVFILEPSFGAEVIAICSGVEVTTGGLASVVGGV